MKKILFAALAVCAVFASCTTGNNNGSKNEEMTLVVQFPEEVTYAETRMIDAPQSASSVTTLSNAVVFLMNTNAVAYRETVTPSDITGGYKKFDNVPSTVNSVIVVGNIPTGELTAVQALTQRSDIEYYAFTVASQATSGLEGKTLMGSTSTFTSGTNPGLPTDTDNYYTADVVLKSLVGRFEINGTVNGGTDIKNIKLEGVWMNNFYMTNAKTSLTFYNDISPVWDIVPASNTAGSATPIITGTVTIPSYTPAQYHEVYNASVNGTTAVYAFNLFAGAYVPHLILLVSGQYDNDDYFLGWVTYNYFTDNVTTNRIASVDNNVIYKIGAITVNAKDITIDPELQGFDLGLKCTLEPWTEKAITPGIQ